MRASSLRVRLLALLVLLLLPLSLAACLGPKPVVRSYSTQPPPAGSDQPYRVDVVVANEGPGGGQAEVEVDLVDHATGEIVAQQTQDIDLQKDQTIHVE